MGTFEPDPCPAGSYNNATGTNLCFECLEGHYCLGGYNLLSDCLPGPRPRGERKGEAPWRRVAAMPWVPRGYFVVSRGRRRHRSYLRARPNSSFVTFADGRARRLLLPSRDRIRRAVPVSFGLARGRAVTFTFHTSRRRRDDNESRRRHGDDADRLRTSRGEATPWRRLTVFRTGTRTARNWPRRRTARRAVPEPIARRPVSTRRRGPAKRATAGAGC